MLVELIEVSELEGVVEVVGGTEVPVALYRISSQPNSQR